MKKVLSLLLAAVLMMSLLVAPASAASFPDVSDGKMQQNIAVLQMLGVIDGYADGTFRPNGKLTRAEFCKMAVYLMGKSEDVGQYGQLTIFPDVRANFWAAKYINYCVKSAKIIAGRPTGRFDPNSTITCGEAVTILMRMLGYTDADVGSVWPMGYINAAIEAGINEGVTLSAYAEITRAQAAQLFCNVLGAKMKDGSLYAATISGEIIEDAVVSSVNATADDGSKGNIRISGAGAGVYKSHNQGSSTFEGAKGTLLLDKKGVVMTFVPDTAGTSRVMTLSEAKYTYLLGTDGTKVTVQESTKVYKDGESANYSDIWLDLRAGTEIKIFYTGGGVCDYLFITTEFSSISGTVVLKADSSGNANPLVPLFGLDNTASYRIVKDGAEVDAEALKKYDVASYSPDTKTFYVSSLSLQGIYEAAYPNKDTPVRITLMGKEFELLDQAKEEITKMSLGSRITLLLTTDGKVASVMSGANITDPPIGVVTAADADKITVELTNGMTFEGGVNTVGYLPSKVIGKFVELTSNTAGCLSVREINKKAPSKNLDLSNRQIGDAELSTNVKMYDTAGSGVPVRVSFSSIAITEVPARKILHVGYDDAGKVDLIIFNNVTGDGYLYGLVSYDTDSDIEDQETEEGDESVGKGVYLTNADGIEQRFKYSVSIPNGNQKKPGGIAVSKTGAVLDYIELNRLEDVSRSDFEDGYVVSEGMKIPLAETVHIYMADQDKWITDLSQARTYSDDMTVYYDRTVEEGGKVRVIIAN